MDRTRTALRQMTREDRELAARLVLQSLPAAAARISPPLAYDLIVGELGTWRVAVTDAGATVERRDPSSDNGAPAEVDFRLETDPAGLAAMAAGTSPLRLMLGGRVRIRGKRRRALKLRAMAGDGDLSLADALAAGAELDADAVYRSLEYLIDPEWTRGHRFVLAYEVSGEGGGTWYVHVNDGDRGRGAVEAPEDGVVAGATRLGIDTYRCLMPGLL